MNMGHAAGETDPPLPSFIPGVLLPRGLIVLLGLSAAVVTGVGLWLSAWLIGPVFLALVIVIAVSPLQTWLLRHGVPRWLATLALVVAVYGILLSLFVVMIISVARLATLLPQYAANADHLVSQIGDVMARFGVQPAEVQTAASAVDVNKLVDLAVSLLSQVTNLVTNIVFLFSLLLFLSFESNSAEARLRSIAMDRPRIAAALGEFAKGTRSYLVVTTVFGAVVAAFDTIALALLGIPLAVTWGLLSFMTNYIPNVGFIIGVIPPALLALLDGGWQLMLIVIGVYILLNFVGQSLIQPRFVGNAVGLSSTVAFLALLFWAWLIGPVGAILAIPLTLLAKALLVDVDPDAKWADALLGLQRVPRDPRRRDKGRRRRRKARQAGAADRAAVDSGAAGTAVDTAAAGSADSSAEPGPAAAGVDANHEGSTATGDEQP